MFIVLWHSEGFSEAFPKLPAISLIILLLHLKFHHWGAEALILLPVQICLRRLAREPPSATPMWCESVDGTPLRWQLWWYLCFLGWEVILRLRAGAQVEGGSRPEPSEGSWGPAGASREETQAKLFQNLPSPGLTWNPVKI